MGPPVVCLLFKIGVFFLFVKLGETEPNRGDIRRLVVIIGETEPNRGLYDHD